MDIQIKRIYEDSEKLDGLRILVDRLWPRGVSKEKAHLDLWLKEIAPSTQLRTAFCHKVENWLEFQDKYYEELSRNPCINELVHLAEKNKLTLIYAAKDPNLNHVLVLKNFILAKEK